MVLYQSPVWRMAKQALEELGGSKQFVPLISIVRRVLENWPDQKINEHTIRLQVRRFCVNGHPGHDAFPDKGKGWRESPTFVSDGKGSYRLFDPEKDRKIFDLALAQDQEKITPLPPKPEMPPRNIPVPGAGLPRFRRPIDLLPVLEQIGKKMGFETHSDWGIPLGRLALVWTLDLPMHSMRPQPSPLPVFGFEFEADWDHRKFIKGKIQNLVDSHVPIGVLVQQQMTRRFQLEPEPLIKDVLNYLRVQGYHHILIWTQDDVIQLARKLGVFLRID